MDDLLGFIWAKCWEEFNFDKLKKKMIEDKKKASKDASDSDDVEVVDDDLEEDGTDKEKIDCDLQCNGMNSLPDNYTCPEVVLDGKWYPPGYPTYVAYVCKFTRINDEFVHLFACNGKELDTSKALNRRDERKKKLREKMKRGMLN